MRVAKLLLRLLRNGYLTKTRVVILRIVVALSIAISNSFPAWATEHEVEELLSDLASPQFAVRQESTRKLLAFGKAACPQLADVALKGELEASRRAIEILRSMIDSEDGATYEAARNALDRVRNNSSGATQKAAVEAILGRERDLVEKLKGRAEFAFHASGHVRAIKNVVEYGGNWGIENQHLPLLAAFRELESLAIVGEVFANDGYMAAAISDVGAIHLGKLQSLKELSLEGVGDEGLVHVGELVNLRRLQLNGQTVTSRGLTALRRLTKLEHLEFVGCSINDLGTLGEMPSVQKLVLQYLPIRESGFNGFAGLPNVRDLYLHCPNQDGKFDKIFNTEFLHVRHLTRLEKLEVFGSRLSDEGLAGLENLTELRDVNLHHCAISDDGLKVFRKLTRLERLRVITPYGNSATGTGLVHLEKLVRLRSLMLSGKMTAKALGEMPVLPALEDIYLHCKEGTPDLPQFAKMPNLVKVNITPITDHLLKQMAGLQRVESIQGEDGVTDAGAAAIAAIPNVKHLTLDYSKITDKGIAEICKLQRIETLGLSRATTDKSVEHVLKLKSLRTLWISHTAITEEGFLRFAAMRELKQIGIRRGKFSDAAVNRFRTTMPKCEVFVQ